MLSVQAAPVRAAPAAPRCVRPARPAVVSALQSTNASNSSRRAALLSVFLALATAPRALAAGGETPEERDARQKIVICGPPGKPKELNTPYARKFCGKETKEDKDNAILMQKKIEERIIISKQQFGFLEGGKAPGF